MHSEIAPRVCFPGGRRRALSMSYDDGSEHDRRLVALFNAYGVRGTFHLTSTTLGQDYRVGRDEVVSLYAGHEVAGHGATHTDLCRLDDEGVRRELVEDKAILEDITGAPVRGFAYPYGTHDDRIRRLTAEAGFVYARGISDEDDGRLPDMPMALTTTCHHHRAVEHGRRLLDSDVDGLRWMRVRGHSYEFDGFMTADASKDWDYIEAFCAQMADERIWHAPLIAVLDYLDAARHLRRDDSGGWINPSGTSVWVTGDEGQAREIAAGSEDKIGRRP